MNMPPASPVIPNMVDGQHRITFRCAPGIACWNACCSNIDISLTPYDLLRLRKRLDLSSAQLLTRYTLPYELDKDDIAGVKLRPVEGGTACPFMRPEGCAVYEDRPTACRYYPVALLSMRKQDEYVDHDHYALVREDHCQGHCAKRSISIDDYRREQGVELYDDLSRGWRQLILKKKSSGPTVGKPSLKSRQLFFMACYDLDQFRAFVASEGFGALFALPAEEREKIVSEDLALMAFGFRFVRQVMFGENTIPLQEDAVNARREKQREQHRRQEREAAARIAADEDNDIPPPD
jgi:Fe-S-cluster containining protein